MKLTIHDNKAHTHSLFTQMLTFALPIMGMNLLQLLFNAADMVVIGRFSGREALGAVGATGSLINLIVNLFMGLSVGISVVVAKDYGAQKIEEIRQSVHTSIAVSGLSGIFVSIVGIILCEPLLKIMGTPEDIIQLSTLYMKIFFLGIPANMVFNFGAAILRAVGDSRRPMYFLTVAGIVNVILNMFFVVILDMSVAGVAWATVISQYLAMVLIILCLSRHEGSLRFNWRKLQIHRSKLKEILRIGIPAGLQSVLFSISNVLIQSAVNSFGSVMVAASAAAGNVEGLIGTTMNAYYNAAITFTGQSMGAKKYDRIDEIAKVSGILIFTTWIVLGSIIIFFGRPLLGFYTTSSEVVELGMVRMKVMLAVYFTCGAMNVFPGLTRAMGFSISPMLITLFGTCIMRIVWLLTIFAWYPTPFILFLCYPITWALAGSGQVGLFFYARKAILRNEADLSSEAVG